MHRFTWDDSRCPSSTSPVFSQKGIRNARDKTGISDPFCAPPFSPRGFVLCVSLSNPTGSPFRTRPLLPFEPGSKPEAADEIDDDGHWQLAARSTPRFADVRALQTSHRKLRRCVGGGRRCWKDGALDPGRKDAVAGTWTAERGRWQHLGRRWDLERACERTWKTCVDRTRGWNDGSRWDGGRDVRKMRGRTLVSRLEWEKLTGKPGRRCCRHGFDRTQKDREGERTGTRRIRRVCGTGASWSSRWIERTTSESETTVVGTKPLLTLRRGCWCFGRPSSIWKRPITSSKPTFAISS